MSWPGEKQRHSMSSRGVRTARDRVPTRPTIPWTSWEIEGEVAHLYKDGQKVDTLYLDSILEDHLLDTKTKYDNYEFDGDVAYITRNNERVDTVYLDGLVETYLAGSKLHQMSGGSRGARGIRTSSKLHKGTVKRKTVIQSLLYNQSKDGKLYNVSGYDRGSGTWSFGTAVKDKHRTWRFVRDHGTRIQTLSPRHIKIYGTLPTKEYESPMRGPIPGGK